MSFVGSMLGSDIRRFVAVATSLTLLSAALVVVPTVSSSAVAGDDLPVNANTAEVVDNAFGQLYFDYSNHVNIDPSPGTDCIDSTADCTGKSAGNKVLFRDAREINGQKYDVLVTTSAVQNITIRRYMVGAPDVGIPGAFRMLLYRTGGGGTPNNVDLTYEFFKSGTYGTPDPKPVTFQNLQVSAIDVDANEVLGVSDVQGFSLTKPSNVTPNPASPVFPADMTFQASNSATPTIPQNQVVTTFGSTSSFTLRYGRTTAAQNGQFAVGFAFKALPFIDPDTGQEVPTETVSTQ